MGIFGQLKGSRLGKRLGHSGRHHRDACHALYRARGPDRFSALNLAQRCFANRDLQRFLPSLTLDYSKMQTGWYVSY